MKITDFRGLKVLSAGGRLMGHVADFEVDPGSMRITGLVVKLEKDAGEVLGLHRTFGSPTIVLGVEHVQAVSDAVLLRESIHDLAHALEGHAVSP